MLNRLFGKLKKREEQPSREELPVDRPTIGLCFNSPYGIDYSSKYLADEGLKCILKSLKAYRCRATFLCPAKLCDTDPDHVTRLADAGHEVAVLGFADESPKDLTDDALKQLVFSCRSAFTRLGLNPIGFRSPHSNWDERLCRELARQRFLYSTEHDHAKQMYVLVPGSPPLVRVPIRTDDRGLRRSEKTYDATVSKHFRVLRKAIQETHFVSVCFHPWILAEDTKRMEHWESWLKTATNAGGKVVALEDALPAQCKQQPKIEDQAP